MGEFIRFCIVGVITFVIDYGLLYVLTERFGYSYLISSGIAFTVAVLINYVLCLFYVFKNSRNGIKQISIFVLTSIIGLLLNQICMWLFVEIFGFYYMLAKIGTTGIVMIWNFVTKRMALKE